MSVLRAGYFKSVYSIGIEPYVKSLKKHGIVCKNSILDVGCGPGQWTFAVARLNPEALVVGIDIDETLLSFANKYMMDNNVKNCRFLKESYENLLAHFHPESLDVILCNGVVQYVDEVRVFSIFSRLLKKNGVLIMFYNHGPGYYLKHCFMGIKSATHGDILWSVKTLIISCIRKRMHDHFVTLRHLQRISADVGINLDRVQTEPKLKYQDKYVGLSYVFSCKGIKV